MANMTVKELLDLFDYQMQNYWLGSARDTITLLPENHRLGTLSRLIEAQLTKNFRLEFVLRTANLFPEPNKTKVLLKIFDTQIKAGNVSNAKEVMLLLQEPEQKGALKQVTDLELNYAWLRFEAEAAKILNRYVSKQELRDIVNRQFE